MIENINIGQTTLDVNKTTFAGLDRLTRHLAFHTNRQSVISANLANLDTPGYRAHDLAFSETLTVHRTEENTWRSMDFESTPMVADDEQPDQDGNTVALEGQMAKMASNMMRYRSLAELVNRKVGMLRYAATDGHS